MQLAHQRMCRHERLGPIAIAEQPRDGLDRGAGARDPRRALGSRRRAARCAWSRGPPACASRARSFARRSGSWGRHARGAAAPGSAGDAARHAVGRAPRGATSMATGSAGIRFECRPRPKPTARTRDYPAGLGRSATEPRPGRRRSRPQASSRASCADAKAAWTSHTPPTRTGPLAARRSVAGCLPRWPR